MERRQTVHTHTGCHILQLLITSRAEKILVMAINLIQVAMGTMHWSLDAGVTSSTKRDNLGWEHLSANT